MALENPLPVTLSPSRLQDFKSCPRRFQHGSIDRIPQPASYASAKGNVVHHIFENLFLAAPEHRTSELAFQLVKAAEDEILTENVVEEIGLDDALRARLTSEVAAILRSYFEMENPSTVNSEGVELAIRETIGGVPMYGILDRLDREVNGDLTIIDYKTGSLPNRNYDSQTFANTEIYAALCEENLGERPKSIRLLYVAHGQAIERAVSEPVLKARRASVAEAWSRITRFYDDGVFPATPSKSACRFCSFKSICRSNGVAVPA